MMMAAAMANPSVSIQDLSLNFGAVSVLKTLNLDVAKHQIDTLTVLEDKTKGNRKYFTLGAGLKYQVFGLNVSYIVPSGSGINQNPLSNTLRFSLLFDLDGSATEK